MSPCLSSGIRCISICITPAKKSHTIRLKGCHNVTVFFSVGEAPASAIGGKIIILLVSVAGYNSH